MLAAIAEARAVHKFFSGERLRQHARLRGEARLRVEALRDEDHDEGGAIESLWRGAAAERSG